MWSDKDKAENQTLNMCSYDWTEQCERSIIKLTSIQSTPKES